MPAKSPEAIQRKINNRKSAKDIGREKKIAGLGGTPITIIYGKPLSDTLRKERTEYLYDLMYPTRNIFKSSGRSKLTEAEAKEKERQRSKENYRKIKEARGEAVRDYIRQGLSQCQTPWYRLWAGAKNRATKGNYPFSIEQEDVKELVINLDYCPVLGIKINWEANKLEDNSPTLDKIVPELGYIKGNIAIISAKANRIKNNATVDEIGKLYCWLIKTKAHQGFTQSVPYNHT
jgi:hypothetical protein